MTLEERLENDRRIESHIAELGRIAHEGPFFTELLADLKTMRQRLADANESLSSIKGIGFSITYADSDGKPVTEPETKVMMYNAAAITDEDASKLLASGCENDPRVVVMGLDQAKNLFPYLAFEPEECTSVNETEG